MTRRSSQTSLAHRHLCSIGGHTPKVPSTSSDCSACVSIVETSSCNSRKLRPRTCLKDTPRCRALLCNSCNIRSCSSIICRFNSAIASSEGKLELSSASSPSAFSNFPTSLSASPASLGHVLLSSAACFASEVAARGACGERFSTEPTRAASLSSRCAIELSFERCCANRDSAVAFMASWLSSPSSVSCCDAMHLRIESTQAAAADNCEPGPVSSSSQRCLAIATSKVEDDEHEAFESRLPPHGRDGDGISSSPSPAELPPPTSSSILAASADFPDSFGAVSPMTLRRRGASLLVAFAPPSVPVVAASRKGPGSVRKLARLPRALVARSTRLRSAGSVSSWNKDDRDLS
mmetsp:Transcript_46456/g.100132  ORF Transcript_46456/g.100132 Transcript_46456/m.100132 type:complete len:349 (+) Transcript_46456:60-1106(+)